MVDTYKYKVKYGFGATEFVVVDAGPELEKAIAGMSEQTPVALGDKIIQGKNIISIEPHYHAYTGWYEHYQPKDGDDWKQIERDCPDFTGIFEQYAEQVRQKLQSGQQIGTGEPLKIEASKPVQGSQYAQKILAAKHAQ